MQTLPMSSSDLRLSFLCFLRGTASARKKFNKQNGLKCVSKKPFFVAPNYRKSKWSTHSPASAMFPRAFVVHIRMRGFLTGLPVQPSSYLRSFVLCGGRRVFLAICGGDVPSDFLNPYPRLYLRPISIRPMKGSTRWHIWFTKWTLSINWAIRGRIPGK